MADQKASADAPVNPITGSELLLAIDGVPDNVTISMPVLLEYIRVSESAVKTLLYGATTDATPAPLGGGYIGLGVGALVAFEGYVLAMRASGVSPRLLWQCSPRITPPKSAAAAR
mgnify:CR=1 FL=1